MNVVFKYCIIFGAILCFLSGCQEEKKPEGFPGLLPAVITLTQEGTPLVGAQIEMIPKDQSVSRWPVTGETNESGKAPLFTYGKHRGCPAGEYKIVVRKNEFETKEKVVPSGVDPAEVKLPPPKVYSLVELQYTDVAQTSLNVTIAKGTKEYTFDVGKKVRISMGQIHP